MFQNGDKTGCWKEKKFEKTCLPYFWVFRMPFEVLSITLTFGDILVKHQAFLVIQWSNKISRVGGFFWLVCCGVLLWGFILGFCCLFCCCCWAFWGVLVFHQKQSQIKMSAQAFIHISISFFGKSRSPHWETSDFNWTFPACSESYFQTPSWCISQWESWFWQLKKCPKLRVV